MICFKKDGIWVVDLKNKKKSQSCSSVGHESQSETLYPEICTPAGADYSYVDNPGFKETRGLGIEISNTFFREEVTKTVDNFNSSWNI